MATKRRSSRKSSSTRVIKRASAIESLTRARTGSCPQNEAYIVHHFVARGIPADQITPRENVLTFHAWRALGRTVRKGERGCTIGVYVPMTGKGSESESSTDSTTEKRAGKSGRLARRSATVFHITQTQPLGTRDGAEPLKLHPEHHSKVSVSDTPNTPRWAGSKWSKAAIERTIVELAQNAGFDPRGCFEESHDGELVDFNFGGSVPSEIVEGCEGLPACVRMAFSGNARGGGGEDTMSRIGADEMIRLATDWAIRGATGAVEYLKENAGPECGLALFLHESRSGALVRELPPVVETTVPPMGSSFDLCGESFTVGELNDSPYAIPSGTGWMSGFYLPERFPVDAGTLSIEGEEDSTLPPF